MHTPKGKRALRITKMAFNRQGVGFYFFSPSSRCFFDCFVQATADVSACVRRLTRS
jgi:hypothetical protein